MHAAEKRDRRAATERSSDKCHCVRARRRALIDEHLTRVGWATGNEIHNAPQGLRSIERRGSSFDDLCLAEVERHQVNECEPACLPAEQWQSVIEYCRVPAG